uniref:Uncharacterized protein n=1 Tax=Arundo donax TaxID=35708 RepID=A0A0A9HEH4_ARUDO
MDRAKVAFQYQLSIGTLVP